MTENELEEMKGKWNPDRIKPTILYLSVKREPDLKILRDLVKGYNVMFRHLYENSASCIISSLQRNQCEFVLVPDDVKTHVVAEAKRYSPIGTTFLRVERVMENDENGYPQIVLKYFHIKKIEEVLDPFISPSDPKLPNYTQSKRIRPTYMYVDESEEKGYREKISEKLEYKPLTEEEKAEDEAEIARWLADHKSATIEEAKT